MNPRTVTHPVIRIGLASVVVALAWRAGTQDLLWTGVLLAGFWGSVWLIGGPTRMATRVARLAWGAALLAVTPSLGGWLLDNRGAPLLALPLGLLAMRLLDRGGPRERSVVGGWAPYFAIILAGVALGLGLLMMLAQALVPLDRLAADAATAAWWLHVGAVVLGLALRAPDPPMPQGRTPGD